MILQSIIQQSQVESTFYEDPILISWEGATTGNYQTLPGVAYNLLYQPTTEGENTYNHHPFLIEFEGAIHAIYSTHNQDEEGTGQYVRYQKSTDLGQTWSSPVTLFEPQDDITRDYTIEGGRVILPGCFVIYNNELYAIGDVNDRDNAIPQRGRFKVGVLCRKINTDGTFGTVYWIENKDGTLTAPASLSGFPTYTFNSSLRDNLRSAMLGNEHYRPIWYYSVPDSDPLYSRSTFNGNVISEPAVIQLSTGQYFRLWRAVGGDTSMKVADNSDNGVAWNPPYQTNIPDWPSRTEILKLSDGRIAIIGNNQNTERSPLYLALCEEDFVITSDNIYDVDVETSPPTFGGDGKGVGVQYPYMIQLSNGKLMIIYSVNKEAIKTAIFDVPTI